MGKEDEEKKDSDKGVEGGLEIDGVKLTVYSSEWRPSSD